MKKAMISFLVMTLMLTSISLVNISSVQAATTGETVETSTDNTIKVSLENIREIMTENNLDIKILYNKMKIQKEKYDAAKDDYDSAEEDRDTAKTNYDDAVAASDPTAASKKTILDNAEKFLDTADTNLTTARDSYKTARDAYEQGTEDKVYAAQDAYIKYLSNLSDKKLKEDTVKSSEKEIQVYKLQYDNGFISKNKYTYLLHDNTATTNELKELKDAEELARIKLCYTLGISPEANITFDTNTTANFEVISKINYEDDLNQMLSKNIDIKLQNDEIDDLEDKEDTYDDNNEEDLYDYMVDNADIELKQLINDTETRFKGQYNTVMNSYNSIKNSYDKLNDDEKSYAIMETKYDYGFASKREVDDAKLTLDKERATFNTSKNTLYVNYLRYLQMKEGY